MTDRSGMVLGRMRWALIVAALTLAALLSTAGPVTPAQAQPAPTTVTFEYTSGVQTWTVPAGVTRATFDVYGASGGVTMYYQNPPNGGLGGRATAVLTVPAGGTVAIVVGGEGGRGLCLLGGNVDYTRGGFNGGGGGGVNSQETGTCPGASGGGASDVRIGGTGLQHRALVAGGGGGGAYVQLCDLPATADNASGGGGGGLIGASGGCHGAAGGNQDGTSGSGKLGQGGDGYTPEGCFTCHDRGGGGGGGGYYGGAGGDYSRGGGGGSGYGPAGTVFQTGVREGNGRVVITYARPRVDSVDPHTGPETGGTVVTIRGDGFATAAGATTVAFGATPATAVSCASSTVCTATSPAGTGEVPVRVTVGGQTSAQSGSFLYIARPVVTMVSPDRGLPGGGTEVTLTGNNFAPGSTSVSFGTVPATRVGCSSSTTCFATSPAGTGTVQVTVTTPFGMSNGVPFTYAPPPAPPGVISISPTRGPVAGGTRVTITGADFATAAGATTVSFGAADATAVSCASSTVCTATSPARCTDNGCTVPVRVTVDGRTSTDDVNFTYDATPPATTIGLSPASPNGQNGWYTSAVGVSITATDADDSTDIQTRCALDPAVVPAGFGDLPSTPCAYLSRGASVGAGGPHTIYAASQDSAGNTESAVRSRSFKVDTTAPVVTRNPAADGCSLPGTNGWCRGTQTAGFGASDAVSGLADAAQASFTRSSSTEGAAVTIASGAVVDVAGNGHRGINAGPFKIDKTAPAFASPPVNQTVNAGGPAGAVVSFPATATDNLDPAPKSTCSHASGGMFVTGTTTVTCTATDQAGNASTVSFTVTVTGAAAQLADLKTAVAGVGSGTSLTEKAQAAQAALQKRDTATACGELGGFLNEVRAQDGKKLTSAQAQQFTADATRIRAVLACR